MHNSGMFQTELRGQDLQQNDRITYTEYTLRLVYSPGYGYAATPTENVAQNQQGGSR